MAEQPTTITVYYKDGSTATHKNVVDPDRVLELENLAYSDPTVVEVKAIQPHGR
jgi:hypothetical protein